MLAPTSKYQKWRLPQKRGECREAFQCVPSLPAAVRADFRSCSHLHFVVREALAEMEDEEEAAASEAAARAAAAAAAAVTATLDG